jgi:hypothetical protein
MYGRTSYRSQKNCKALLSSPHWGGWIDCLIGENGRAVAGPTLSRFAQIYLYTVGAWTVVGGSPEPSLFLLRERISVNRSLSGVLSWRISQASLIDR